MIIYPFDGINLETYIQKYEKKDSDIIVKTAKNKKYRVFRTKENESKILKTMEEQMNLAKKENYIEKKDEATTYIHKTVPWVFITGTASVTFYLRAGVDFAYILETIVFGLEALMFSGSALYYKSINYFKKDFDKNSVYLDNKTKINKYIKQNPSSIEIFNSKARKEIETNISDELDEPLNINTMRLIKLKQLKKLLEQARFYDKFNFEDADDVIDKLDTNQVKDLIEKYDNKKELILSRDK